MTKVPLEFELGWYWFGVGGGDRGFGGGEVIRGRVLYEVLDGSVSSFFGPVKILRNI